jgi:hypothetical protein
VVVKCKCGCLRLTEEAGIHLCTQAATHNRHVIQGKLQTTQH